MAKRKTAAAFAAWFILVIGSWAVFFILEKGGILSAVFGSALPAVSLIAVLVLALIPLVLRLFYHTPLRRILLVMLICWLTFSASMTSLHFGTNAYLRSFSADKWMRYPYQREQMVESLSTSHALIGMDGDEIVSLLGSPDRMEDRTWLYRISEEAFFTVQYDAGGKTARISISRDNHAAELSAY